MRRVNLLSFLAVLVFPSLSAAAPITLFQNNFEAPTGIIIPSGCCGDATQQSVNSLYGTAFQQTFTVETLAIHGPQGVYSDPSGIGGNYAIGMLSDVQNDLLSLTFNTTGLAFLNLGWDLAAVGIDQPGGPPATPTFLTGASTYSLTLYNTPGGVFNINSLGSFAVLDTQSVTSGPPLPGGLTFNWSHHVVALDATGSTDGNVTLLINLTAGGYGSFDNVLIAASDTAGELPGATVPEPSTLVLLGAGLAAARRTLRARARRA